MSKKNPTLSGMLKKGLLPLLQVCLVILALTIGVFSTAASGIPQSSASSMAAGSTGEQSLPDAVCPPDGQCFADVPSSSTFYSFVNRLYQQDLVSGYPCGGAGEPCDSENRPYYRPGSNVTRQQMSKFIDNARRLPDIFMQVSTTVTPVYISNTLGSAIYAEVMSNTAISGVGNGEGSSIGVSGVGGSAGVFGHSSSGNGMIGSSAASNAAGVQGFNSSTFEGTGVSGTSDANKLGVGVSGTARGDAGVGVVGASTSSNLGTGVRAESVHGYGLDASADCDTCRAVNAASTSGVGVYSFGGATGVYGYSQAGSGVSGHSLTGPGVNGFSSAGNGVVGYSDNQGTGYGIFGYSATQRAGYFDGNVTVTGTCCAMGEGTTQIDDPTDPENKYLNQALVQSSDLSTVESGNVTTDANGDAIIQLPDYFQAANSNFRYQLTPIGTFAQAIVSQEIENNAFAIKTDKPNVKISWMVIGTRQDPYATTHPITPEQTKPADAQGKYLHPAELGQPVSSGVNYEQEQQIEQAAQPANKP